MSGDSLSPEIIKEGLNTRFVGQRVVYYPRLSSTMDVARKAALIGAAEGTIILAGEQTAGRGRLKRAWLATEGSLTFSLILYPETRLLPFLVMVSVLAVADVVEAQAPLKTTIKWPNDILIDGKKVCGILMENGIKEGGPGYAVTGIGLNVNLDTEAYPDIAGIATSLSLAAGRRFSRADILRELCGRLEHWYQALKDGAPVFEVWRGRLTTLGQEVRVRAGAEVFQGVAEDVASDGALLLRQADGRLLKMPAGDVTLRS